MSRRMCVHNIQCAFVFASACACSCMIAVMCVHGKSMRVCKKIQDRCMRNVPGLLLRCYLGGPARDTNAHARLWASFSSILACNICHQGRGTALLQLLRLRGGGDARRSGGQQAHSSVFLQDTERRKTQAACKQAADAAPVSERSPQEILDAAMRREVDAFFSLSQRDTLFLCACVGGAGG